MKTGSIHEKSLWLLVTLLSLVAVKVSVADKAPPPPPAVYWMDSDGNDLFTPGYAVQFVDPICTVPSIAQWQTDICYSAVGLNNPPGKDYIQEVYATLGPPLNADVGAGMCGTNLHASKQDCNQACFDVGMTNFGCTAVLVPGTQLISGYCQCF